MDAKPLLNEIERPFVRKSGKTPAEEWKFFKEKSESDFEISIICNIGFICTMIVFSIVIEYVWRLNENASVGIKSSFGSNAGSSSADEGINDVNTYNNRVPRIQFQHFRKRCMHWTVYFIIAVVMFLYLQVHYSTFM